MPRCSIILVTYNSGMEIEGCLRALPRQDCEIVVVDNASLDDTVARIRAVGQTIPLQLICISRNIGFAGGANHGAGAAGGDVLLLLNPDAVAEFDAIGELLRCMERSGAAAAGGSLLANDGQPEKGFAFRRLPDLRSLLFEVLLLNQLWPGNPVNRRYRCLGTDYSREQVIEQPAGACIAVNRETWSAIGGLDTQFFPVWFEDVDLCARIRAVGGRIVYCPEARFRHSGAHSVGKMSHRDKQVFWYSNMLRYCRKHFPAWKVGLLRIGILVGAGLRAVASLLGVRPRELPLREALLGYWSAAMVAMGRAQPPAN